MSAAAGEPPHPPGALAGLRVLDFTHFLAGPVATLILADGGAEVIKIENAAGGDNFRHFLPADPRLGGEGIPFHWCNRNKQSVALDLKSPAGRDIALALAREADIVVENFSGKVMESLGLGWEVLRAANPRLIYCAISAYGRDGEFASRLGFDPVTQAESGFMSLNGYPDRDGVRSGSSVMDISTGMMACNAILQAVIARARTGRGQMVEVALYDTAITMTGYVSMQNLFNGFQPKRIGNGSADTVPTGVFQTADKPIFVVCTSTAIFRRLYRDVLGRPDLADDPELQKPAVRMARRDELVAQVQAFLLTRGRNEWLPLLARAGVPAGAVRTVEEALHSPETRARGLVTQIEHPTAGQVPNVAFPIRMHDTPVRKPVAAPLLGQHTESVLRERLGLDEAAIMQARASGAFGKPS